MRKAGIIPHRYLTMIDEIIGYKCQSLLPHLIASLFITLSSDRRYNSKYKVLKENPISGRTS